MHTTPALAIACVLAIVPVAHAMPPERVHMEIAFEQRGGLDTPHQWLNDLKPLRFASLKLRAARRGEVPGIEVYGNGAERRARVTAVLASNSLQLPDRRIRRGEMGVLREWLARLDADNRSADDQPGAFGLAARDLQRLQNQLASPLTEETAGIRVRDLLARCEATSGIDFVWSRDAADGVSDGATVVDSMQGLAAGTAAAAALRAIHLAMIPVPRSDGSIRMQIEPVRANTDSWPVGRFSRAPIATALPKLNERVPVEMNGVSLAKALRTLQPRIGVPLLVDYGKLSSTQADLEQVIVNVPGSRTRYKTIFDRILSQARLQLEVRTDDGDRAFLWIQPIRRKSQS